MRSTRFVGAAIGALVALVPPASARPFQTPLFFTGSQPPGDETGPSVMDPYLVNLVYCSAYWDLTPQAAAQHAAADIIAGLTDAPWDGTGFPRPSFLAGRPICIVIDHFAMPEDIPPSDTGRYGARLFREEDRLSGLDDEGVIVVNPGGVITHDPSWPNPPPDPAHDDHTARSYRHPFLSNAWDTVPTPNPLGTWMEAFCAEYDAMRNEQGHVPYYGPALPIPDAFAYDSEVPIASPDANSMFMLWYLYTHAPYMWNNAIVPGQPEPIINNLPVAPTLANIYAADAAFYGLPAALDDPATGLRYDFPAQHWRNRPIMEWWLRLTARTGAAVMTVAAYDIVHQHWPNCICGNYGEALSDGLQDTTGYFMDRDCDGELNPVTNLPCDTRHVASVFPRTFIDPQFGGAMFRDGTGAARWLALPQVAFGDVDSPYLYGLNCCQTGNQSGCSGCWQVPLQQPNLYLPGQPAETQWQTTMRINRFNAKSIINSYGGGHEGRFKPYLEMGYNMIGAANPNHPADWRVVTDRQLAESLATHVRANNAKEAIFWSNWSLLPQDSDQRSAAQWAWHTTAVVTRSVYAPRVQKVVCLSGAFTHAADQYDLFSRLEHTLRGSNGQPRTIDILSDENGVAALLVRFTGLECYPSDNVAPPTGCLIFGAWHPPYMYDIRVEDQAGLPGTLGYVLAYDFAAEGWFKVLTAVGDCCQGPWEYEFFTDDLSSRRVFRLVGDGVQRFVARAGDAAPVGSMVLMLVHKNGSGSYTSKFDLIQVQPLPTSYITLNGAEPAKQSDLNFDGAVSAADLAKFLANWFQQSEAADINLDGQVDELDLALYLANFANGT